MADDSYMHERDIQQDNEQNAKRDRLGTAKFGGKKSKSITREIQEAEKKCQYSGADQFTNDNDEIVVPIFYSRDQS